MRGNPDIAIMSSLKCRREGDGSHADHSQQKLRKHCNEVWTILSFIRGYGNQSEDLADEIAGLQSVRFSTFHQVAVCTKTQNVNQTHTHAYN